MLSWWWKIDDARAPDQIPTVAFGQPIDMGRSRLTPEALQLRETSDKGQKLVLQATIENVTGSANIVPFGVPAKPPQLIIAGQEQYPPEIILVRDDAMLAQLQPRMPEKVELIWPLPSDWQPGEVDINFSQQLFKLRDNFYGKSSWLGFVPIGKMTALPERAW